MELLEKLSSFFLKVGAVADRESLLETKLFAIYERDAGQTAQMNKENRATTIKSFLIILVASLFLFTFLGFVIARRNNRRALLNDGNIEGEQPDEEHQNAAAAEANPGSLQNRFEIEENRTITEHHDPPRRRRRWYHTLEAKCNIGTRLALVNFLAEIPSAIFDQKASEENPGDEKAKSEIPEYLLIAMLLSLTSMLVCLVELVYNGRKERITWRWSNGRMPWFYYPPPGIDRPFGTFAEIIGLVCAMAQCAVSTINYCLSHRNHAATIQFPVMPTIFSFGLLCSRLMAEEPNEEGGESRTSDQEGSDVAVDQALLEPLISDEMHQGAELPPSSNS
ncbi:hypothetical protein DITRI_Ditri01bG0012600 [Diplodiscus trichospermus]